MMPEGDARAPQLSEFVDAIPEFAAMAACVQDPIWHEEGDVLTHTQMVCQKLVRDPRWQQLPMMLCEELWWAAMLHDVAKPARTRLEDGHLRAPGHARAGEIMVRGLLWRMGLPSTRRERVCALVGWHMTPYHFLERSQPQRVVAELSLAIRCDYLATLVDADARGRIAYDVKEMSESVEIFRLFAEDMGCLEKPYAFADAHSRVEFFRHEDRALDYKAYDDSRCRLTLMVGLPGAGKDHWLGSNAGDEVVISLDEMREHARVRRGDARAHGQMIARARERLRVELRAGRDCVWNATSLSRSVRAPLLRLAADYNARVRVVAVECEPSRLLVQNREREHPVPEDVILGLLRRWEAPTLADAHELLSVERVS
jgi:predicted kinase